MDILFDTLDDSIQINICPLLKLSLDKIKIFLYFLLALPLAIGLRFIKQKHLRTLYNLFWGMFFIMFLARSWFLFINFTTILVYIVSKISSNKPFIPVTIIGFAALAYAHFIRWINEDQQWRIDFNVIQMIITCRFVYFAAELEDGKLKSPKPTFFEFYSYIFLFTNIIVGTLPYTDFINFIRLQGHYKEMNLNLRSGLVQFLKALVFTIGEVAIRPKFDFNIFDSPEWYEMNQLQKHGIVFVIAFCARFRYFLAFKFTQSSMDFCGISYNGNENKIDKYDRHTTADYRFEVEYNTKIITGYWNQTVQKWLEECFYKRYVPRYGNKMIWVVFVISAWWHGFFMIYYIFFIEWCIFNEVTKAFYKSKSKFSFIPSNVRLIIAWIYTHIIINETALPVALLEAQRWIRFSSDLYWSSQITIIVLFLFVKITKWDKVTNSPLKQQ